MNNCKLCAKSIATWKRKDCLYCSDFCRKRAYDTRKGRYKGKRQKKTLKGVGK